jgi:hypothetical protein
VTPPHPIPIIKQLVGHKHLRHIRQGERRLYFTSSLRFIRLAETLHLASARVFLEFDDKSDVRDVFSHQTLQPLLVLIG